MFNLFVVTCLLNIFAWIIVKYAILKPPEPLSRLQKGSDIVVVCMIIWTVIVVVPLILISFKVETWQGELIVYIIGVLLGISICMINFVIANKSIYTIRDSETNDEDIKNHILESFFVDILLFVILFTLTGVHLRRYFFNTLHHID
jgi:hypothetical protein